MNKKLNFLFSVIASIILVSTSLTCYAIDGNYLTNKLNGTYSYSLQNETNRPQFGAQNTASEFVDPLTGSLSLMQTDLVLEGRDGHDLVLERRYNSAQATMHTPKAGFELPPAGYVFTRTIYEYQWYVKAIIYDNTLHQEYIEYYPFWDYSEAEKKRYELVKLDQMEDIYNRFSVNPTVEMAYYDMTVEIPYYYSSNLDKLNYQRYRYNVGTGWSFNFPSVQIVRNNMNSQIETPIALYFHAGNGAVYTVEYNNWQGYKFLEAPDETHEFWEGSGYVNNQAVLYCYKDKKEIVYYFGGRGELLRMSDRLGNNIDFTYINETYYSVNSNLIKTITDSVGRVLTFDYNNSDVNAPKITVTVTAPGETKTLTLKYNKEMYETRDKNNVVIGKEPILVSFVNSNNETTYYNDNVNSNNVRTMPATYFTYDSKTLNEVFDYQKTYNYLLMSVQYPHSITYYEYEKILRNLGTDGVTEAFRVTNREDYELTRNTSNQLALGNYKNYVAYDWSPYPMDYTGYPYYNTTKIIPQYENFERIIDENGNRTWQMYKNYSENSADPYIILYNEGTYFDSYNSDFYIRKEYRDFLNKRKPEKIITTVGKGGGSYTTYTELQYYNTFDLKNGMLKSETHPMFLADYNDYWKRTETYAIKYDYQYGELKSKRWLRDLDSYIEEDSVSYNNNKRLSETYGLANRNSFTYEYLTGKNTVTKKTTIKDNGNNDEKIEEFYTSATNYAFPSEIREYYKDENGTEQYRSKTFTYDMFFSKPKTVTDDNGTTEFQYDNLGRLIKEISPIYETYDTVNAKKQYKAERTLDYNNYILGDYGRRILSLGVSEELIHKAVSNNAVVFVSQAEKYYDGFGNLAISREVDTINGVSAWVTNKYFYDSQNNLSSFADPQGNITSYSYDTLNRITQITDPYLNKQITMNETEITSSGRKNKTYFQANGSSAEQYVVENTLDIYGRLIEKCQGGSITEKYTYDLVNNLTSYTDPNNNLNSQNVTNKFTYDGRNRLTEVRNANNELTYISYDDKNNITYFSVDGQTTFTKKYDPQGRLIEDKDALNKIQTLIYDSVGRLETSIDRNNIVTYNEFDNLNNLSDTISIDQNGLGFRNENITPYGATTTWDIKYQGSNGSVLGYISRDLSQTGKLLSNDLRYNYNSNLGRYDYSGYVEDVYDSLGRETLTLAGHIVNNGLYGAATHKTYNKTRLEKVQLNGSQTKNTSDSVNAKYEYYPNGLIKSVAYPPISGNKVLKSEYTYNSLGFLEALTNTLGTDIISKYVYSDYDFNGNVQKITETILDNLGEPVDKITKIGYDKLNRISYIEADGKTTTYSYDSRGNRKTENTTAISFDESDFNFAYDEVNRLKSVTKVDESGTATTTLNEYTSDGLRYSKTVNGTKTYYVFDKQGRITTEVDSNKAITANYIWSPDRTLAKIDNSGTYYYIYNGHGDVVQILDTSGNIVNQYSYDLWGNFEEQIKTIHNPFTYFGQQFDESTGLYYLRARYYDPKTGTFTQEDPIRDGNNWYVYGSSNPALFIDPTGLRNVVIVVGSDRASNNNAFQSNASTFIRDNPNDTVMILKAWDYSSEEELIGAVGNAFGSGGIDALVIESHATTSSLIVTGTYSIGKNSNWDNVKFNQNANVKLTGCNSGGYDGEVKTNSIAQYIADQTRATVWAYTNNTSQKTINGGTYQKPVRMKTGQKVNDNFSKFTPSSFRGRGSGGSW